MLKKVSQTLFYLCGFAGFMLGLGTAGSSDCNLIDTYQITVRVGIAITLMLICYFGLKLSDCEYVD